MKYFTLFVVAVLAVNVSAMHIQHENNIAEKGVQFSQNIFSADFNAAFQHFMDGFKLLFPEPFANFIEKFFEFFQKAVEHFPPELKEAFANVFKHFPSYKDFFPERFFVALAEFFHAFNQYYIPRELHQAIENGMKNFNINDIFPGKIMPTIAKHLETSPIARKIIEQWIMILERLINTNTNTNNNH